MPELILQKERKQARYFVEKLSEDLGLDMILIPGGTFLMGSPEDEPERDDSEGPRHEVTVPTFFMGRYPVTQGQWQVVARFPLVKQELDPDPFDFKGEKHPVENVTWYDAMEFCTKLTVQTGREYRLPTESEWEYACRAGTTTPFYFGQTLTTDIANYDGNYTYNDGPKGNCREETTPVDRFGIANAFGLCDMHGNVFEWCQDHWHSSYEGAPTDGSAWFTDNEKSQRIIRGGSWVDPPRRCRSAYRLCLSPDERDGIISFRVVCSAPRTL